MSVNPNKYVRKAIVDALRAATGLEVYEIALPKDLMPLPNNYIILHSQSKQPFARTKGHYEWVARIVIDVYSVNEKGFFKSALSDDIEEVVMNTMEALQVDGFTVNYTELTNSVQVPVNTPTHSINRQVMNIEQWLNRAL